MLLIMEKRKADIPNIVSTRRADRNLLGGILDKERGRGNRKTTEQSTTTNQKQQSIFIHSIEMTTATTTGQVDK